MKKVFIGLLLTFLVFAACRRKSSNSVTTPAQTDTTDTPPNPPGSSGDSATVQNSDTTNNPVVAKFSFVSQKPVLETENIGLIYKEDSGKILSVYVNICGGMSVYGVAFDFDYDSSKLILKNVAKGDFLGSNAILHWNNSVVGISRNDSTCISGDGTICVIELEAKTSFDSSYIGFKGQSAFNNQPQPVLDSSNWFGGIMEYK